MRNVMGKKVKDDHRNMENTGHKVAIASDEH